MLAESLHQDLWPVYLHAEEDEEVANESINQFEQLCVENGIEYSIHKFVLAACSLPTGIFLRV